MATSDVAPSPWLKCGDHIRWVDVGSTVILLDMRRGIYSAMDSAASAIWRLILSERGGDDVVRGLADKTPGTGHEAARDLDMFVARCLRDGLLDETTEPSATFKTRLSGSRPTSPSPIQAWVRMVQTSWLYKVGGFSAAHAAATKFASDQRAVASAPTTAVESFRAAENWFIYASAPNDCLTRSLALLSHLRRCGHRASHHIGVRLDPVFSAHAWVELDGEPVLDRRDYVGKFAVIAEA